MVIKRGQHQSITISRFWTIIHDATPQIYFIDGTAHLVELAVGYLESFVCKCGGHTQVCASHPSVCGYGDTQDNYWINSGTGHLVIIVVVA